MFHFCHATHPISMGNLCFLGLLFYFLLLLSPLIASLLAAHLKKEKKIKVFINKKKRTYIYDLWNKNNLTGRGGRGTRYKLFVLEFACVLQNCVCMCVFVKAVYGCMSVQSLGSYSSAPTHHWMNIKLYLSGQQRWGVGNTIMLEGVSQSL